MAGPATRNVAPDSRCQVTYSWASLLEPEGEEPDTPLYYLRWEVTYQAPVGKVAVVQVPEVQVPLEEQDRMMPEVTLLGYSLTNNSSTVARCPRGLQGAHPRGQLASSLSATFYLARPLGHYMFDLYLPAACIVLMSWVNFCLSRSLGKQIRDFEQKKGQAGKSP